MTVWFEGVTDWSESSTEGLELFTAVVLDGDVPNAPVEEESFPGVTGRGALALEEGSAGVVVGLAVELSDEEAGVAVVVGSSRDFRERTGISGWRKDVSEEATSRLERENRVIKSIGSFILVVFEIINWNKINLGQDLIN